MTPFLCVYVDYYWSNIEKQHFQIDFKKSPVTMEMAVMLTEST